MPRTKGKQFLTTLSLGAEDQARIDRLKEKLELPMNRIISAALSWLEQTLEAREAGKPVTIDGHLVVFLLPWPPPR